MERTTPSVKVRIIRSVVAFLALAVVTIFADPAGCSVVSISAQTNHQTPFSKELKIEDEKFVVDGWYRIIQSEDGAVPYVTAVGLSAIWVEFKGGAKKIYAPTLLSKDGGNLSDPHPYDGHRLVTIERMECGKEQVYLLVLRFYADGINGLYFYMAARSTSLVMGNVPPFSQVPLCLPL